MKQINQFFILCLFLLWKSLSISATSYSWLETVGAYEFETCTVSSSNSITWTIMSRSGTQFFFDSGGNNGGTLTVYIDNVKDETITPGYRYSYSHTFTDNAQHSIRLTSNRDYSISSWIRHPEAGQETVRSVTLTSAGDLAYYITTSDKYYVKKLTVSGPMNGDDMAIVRWMASDKRGVLTTLDLSQAEMVAGGQTLGIYEDDNDIRMKNGVVSAALFRDLDNLKTLYLPNTVTEIEEQAVKFCDNLETVYIGNQTSRIGYEAFWFCSKLATVYFPASIQSVGINAFTGCNALTKPITEDIQAWAAINFEIGDGDRYYFSNPLYYAHKLYTSSSNAPNSITLNTTNIGTGAFAYNTHITSVSFPEGMTKVGNSAFEDCTSLTTVIANGGLGSVGNNAFKGCTNISTVNIKNLKEWCESFFTITTIEEEILAPDGSPAMCEDYEGEYVITKSVPIIYSNPTCYSKSIKLNGTTISTLTLPEDAVRIGSGAFYNCQNIQSVIFPESGNMTYVGELAFEGCTGLTRCEVPDMGSWCSINFDVKCVKYGDVTIWPEEDNPGFYGASAKVKPYYSSNPATLTNGIYHDGAVLTNVVIPEGSQRIGENTFSNTQITSITIPSSVTAIGDFAFYNCSHLPFVSIPSGVIVIGRCAFNSCSNLSSVTIGNPKPVEIIYYDPTQNFDYSSFSNVANATLYVPTGSKTAYETANVWKNFGTIVEYTNIDFADANVKALCVANWDTNHDGELSMAEAAAVTDLGTVFKENNTISSFNELQYFTGLTSIGNQAFYNSWNLSAITIPNNITSIGESAFYYCYKLTSLNIPSSVTDIGLDAFSRCFGLTSINVDLENTMYDSRDNCNAIIETATNKLIRGCVNTVIPGGITTIGSRAFNDCSSLTSIDIPNSVTTIEYLAFQNCSGLTSVDIPSSVTTLGNGVFSNCSGLTSVTIPNSVTSMDDAVFYYCTSLTSVNVGWAEPVAAPQYFFQNVPLDQATLYVPFGTKAAYEAADVWKDFGTIVEMEEPGISPDDIYLLKNVETGKYLYRGNAWGTHAVLADVGLPAQFIKQSDGSYTIFFPVGSGNQQMLFRADEVNLFVDYYGEGCPFWTFTNTGNGNYLIQTLTTHETYGQEAMPGTYLGNNPTKEANNEGGTPLGVYNDVDGNVTNAEGMNITWTLELVSARSDAQVTLLQELITIAQGLDMDTSEEETVLNNEEATYLEMTGTIVNLQKHIKEREEYLNKANKKKEDLNRLIACANAVDVDTNDAQAVADNSSNLDEINEAINTLRDTYITKLGDGVATTLLPLDVTGAILNPSFVIDDADGWNWNYEEDGPQFQSFNNAEFFETTFDFNQELTGLPNGRYLLKVKGFHRPGTNEDVFNDYQQGTDNACAQLYANDESVTLVNQASCAQDEQIEGWCGTEVSSDGTTRYVPDNMLDAYLWFANGYYENELPITVTDGTLTLGIRLDESVDAGWVIFDDFRLEYQGAASPAITFADDAVKAVCVDNWDTNHDGELSMAEAAAVTDLGEVFRNNEEITSFDELQYFTGLTSIGVSAFQGCTNLVSFVIPENVTSIGSFAFSGNWRLQSIVIPEGVTSIGDDAFSYCGLTAVSLPASLTEIQEYAFSQCSEINSVTVAWEHPLDVPENIFSIGNYNNTVLYVPEGTEDEYRSADVWKDFYINGEDHDKYLALRLLRELIARLKNNGGYMLEDSQLTADVYDSTKEQIEECIEILQEQIKNHCEEAEVSDLPVDATGLITNPSFIIDHNAYWQGDTPQFQSYNNAEFFQTTFDFYQELTDLPNGRYLLKVKGFHRPGSYEDVFNDYRQGINNASAQLYANDESVVLNNLFSDALEEQIDGCGVEVSADGITGYVPDNMHDAYVWFNNGYYENELPVTVTDGTLRLGIRLDSDMEYGWVIFDDFRLEYQGADSPAITFADDAVKAICVANWDTNHDGELSMAEAAAVTDLGEVFRNNEEITSFDELQYFTGLTSIGEHAFNNCHALQSVILPDNVTSIGQEAFSGCYALRYAIIPDGVTSLGIWAFNVCYSLENITIPSSVNSVGEFAFGSIAPTSVTVEWQEPLAVPENFFENVDLANTILYVPVGTKAAYQAADVWKDFGKIVEYKDLVENGSMEEEPSEEWSCFWVREWRTMENVFEGPANIVEDPTNANNHCVKVVVRSEAEAIEAGNMIDDGSGNPAPWDSEFYIQTKDKIESGKRLKLTMRVRADKSAEMLPNASNTPGSFNGQLFGDIHATTVWQKVEKDIIVTPEMTQEENGGEMHTVAFNLTTIPDGNVFYFDDIKLEVMGDTNSKKLLRELIANMEAIGGYELEEAKATADNFDATKEDCEGSITQLQQQIKDRCAIAEGDDLPVDATGLITNPSFTIDNNDYWSGDTPQFQSFNNAEFFETTFDFNQELTGLPNGRYLLKVKGFHRPGSNEDVFNDYLQGTDNACAQLYANDESVTLVNQASGAQDEQIDGWCGTEVSSDGTTRYVPNTMQDAYMWFSNGYYENELPVTVTDGTLTLGIRLDESVEAGWVIFDDFRLEYLEPVLTDDTDRLYADVEKVLIFPGNTAPLSLSLDNGEEYTYNGYQFDIQLPEGVTLAKSGNKYQYTLGDRYSGEGMMVNINARGNGKYSVVCMSMDNICITGTTGTLLTLTLQASDDVSYGEYTAAITNINLSTEGLVNLALSDVEVPVCVSEFEMGDVNHDTAISVTDVMAIVDYILGRASSDFDEDLADINYDGMITVTDVMGLVNVILFSNTHQVPANAITTFENMTMMPTADGFELSTENAYTACQLTVVLPEGGKLTGAYGPSGSKALVNDLGSGCFNVVVYSPEGQPLSSDGSLVRLQIRGNSRGISISDMQLTNRRLETIIPDEATGITEMAGDSSAGDSYNLQGIKVKTPQRGVYIRNGKKETVK